ncbi:triose-phosphate isomerase [Marinobacterium sedimentorum]|uniref:triose-phosphate isomerase n=1 Tax=Marinobacterium sedimentorum TaxID=2927804 RepID=UPI0020C68527|nr:triose-phosphate isomerase [Marinobacterium sedimentorum]MCP8689666.1 triose-phosphate isomerase [Marinobacterium sedimentorum]
MRKSIVAGNWKMNGNLAANAELVKGLLSTRSGGDNVDVLVCPPAVYIPQVAALLQGSDISLGAQNASAFEKGAYTGDLSLCMLAEFGVQYVILGHSERRALFGEDDAQVADKFHAVVAAGATPIVCVGETLQERQAGQTLEVVSRQLRAVLEVADKAKLADAVVAYEPVWAIGTGLTATPEQAQEVHQALRALIAEYDAAAALKVRILYGGSVTADSAAQLFEKPDIDGGLVGGASLKAKDFLAICSAAAGASANG